ncbi:G-type lectin S-receptor-like serine/threonine-protein kinase [Acorus gramineus]|uniref:G-type lectin S-receptor-like serine/threonine-protein kinase n=1 Tax=Acorus gramineus TaxID=55184 RepID=A0AAV9A2S4_ACOGR|nr:G-type lectin S-receptor-like serine/threonine-protein kinase [Acorus gramineus]
MALKNLSHLLLLLFFYPHLTNSQIPLNSILKPPQQLSPNTTTTTWSSPNNIFSFGFLPDSSNTSLFSAAVILSPSSTPGTPALVDSSASIQFQSNGNLRLIDGSGSVIWQSNTSNRGVSVASLDDSGNLALKNATSTVIWDTFSNPTDTVLKSQNLTTASTLRSGPYSFSLLTSGNLTLKWNDSIPYYNKPFNSSFSANSNLTSPVLSFQTNGQTTGILYLIDASLPEPAIVARSNNFGEASVRMRFLRLDTDGNLRAYSLSTDSGSKPSAEWSAVEDQCEVFGYCGSMGICAYNDTGPVCRCPSQNFVPSNPNDSRKGCKLKQEISDCPTNSTMLQLDNTKFLMYPLNEVASSTNEVFFEGIDPCRQNCLAQSGCMGSTSLNDGSGFCYLKISGFVSGYQSPALLSTSFVRVCPPALSNQPVSALSNTQKKKSGLRAGIVVAVVVGALVGLVLLEGVVYYCFCRGSRFGAESAQYALLEYASGAPIQFSYKELQKCTKEFREKLGAGGFGAVYRGTLANQTVKKFSVWAYEEFDKGNIGGIVDKSLNENEIDVEQLKRAIEVCFWCIQEQPSQRPTMGKVVHMLEGIMAIERPPAPKGFDGTISITSGSVSVSAATVTSSPSLLQTMGGSSSVSGRNNEKVSSSLLAQINYS